MNFEFTEAEYEALAGLPIEVIVDLAAELDIVAPEKINRRELLEHCVLGILSFSTEHGLPFSKYDRDDLEALNKEQLSAIAQLQGLAPTASVRAILRRGQRVYKSYQAKRNDHPIPTMLPMLLTAVARAAQAR